MQGENSPFLLDRVLVKWWRFRRWLGNRVRGRETAGPPWGRMPPTMDEIVAEAKEKAEDRDGERDG